MPETRISSKRLRDMVCFCGHRKVDASGNAESEISKLPPEMLAYIFTWLDLPEKARVAQVCKKWRSVAYVPSLWSGVTVQLTPRWIPASTYPSFVLRNIRCVHLNGVDLDLGGLLELGRNVPCIEQILMVHCHHVNDKNLSAAFSCKWPKLKRLGMTHAELKRNSALELIAKNCPNLTELGIILSQKLDTWLLMPMDTGLCRLERLNLSNVQEVSAVGFGHLVDLGLDRLKSVNLKEANANDALVRQVSRLPALRHLSLFKSHCVTDVGLNFLATGACASTLHWLDLSHCTSITDQGMQHLSSMPALSLLSLNGCPVEDVWLEQLARGNSHVQALHLICSSVTNIGLKWLARMRHLKDIRLSSNNITDAGLTHLAESGSSVERLLFWCCCNVTNVGMFNLAAIKGLRWLDLVGMRSVTDNGLAMLVERGCQLETLRMMGCALVTDLAIMHLSRMSSLCELLLDNGPFTDMAFRYLVDYKSHLSLLTLKRCPRVTRDGIQLLSALPKLRLIIDGISRTTH